MVPAAPRAVGRPGSRSRASMRAMAIILPKLGGNWPRPTALTRTRAAALRRATQACAHPLPSASGPGTARAGPTPRATGHDDRAREQSPSAGAQPFAPHPASGPACVASSGKKPRSNMRSRKSLRSSLETSGFPGEHTRSRTSYLCAVLIARWPELGAVSAREMAAHSALLRCGPLRDF